MPGLAKSAETLPAAAPVTAVAQPQGIATYQWEGVPLDVMRHFQVPLESIPTKDIEMLKDITEWAKSKTSDEPSIGNILQQISKIQRELGSPELNQKAYAKVHQFIKLQKTIDEMRKRQDSMRSSPWL